MVGISTKIWLIEDVQTLQQKLIKFIWLNAIMSIVFFTYIGIISENIFMGTIALIYLAFNTIGIISYNKYRKQKGEQNGR